MPAPSEFELIRKYFAAAGASRQDVVLGVGDDAALLDNGGAQLLALCVDTLVAGVHFPTDAPAEAVGHKALAVNLSDLAAMGAQPAWALLSLTMPEPEPDWLAGFRRGLHALAAAHGVALVGGDTTRGPLAVTVTLVGLVERGRALRRDGARPGDRVYVSGTLGDAALGLRQWQAGERAGPAVERLQRPQPRVALGRALLGLASAVVDVSDGLAADLGHILARSGVGARLEAARLPLSQTLQACCSPTEALACALGGGDDYELCFTVPVERERSLQQAVAGLGLAVTAIGTIEAAPGLRLVDEQGREVPVPSRGGYDHFGAAP